VANSTTACLGVLLALLEVFTGTGHMCAAEITHHWIVWPCSWSTPDYNWPSQLSKMNTHMHTLIWTNHTVCTYCMVVAMSLYWKVFTWVVQVKCESYCMPSQVMVFSHCAMNIIQASCNFIGKDGLFVLRVCEAAFSLLKSQFWFTWTTHALTHLSKFINHGQLVYNQWHNILPAGVEKLLAYTEAYRAHTLLDPEKHIKDIELTHHNMLWNCHFSVFKLTLK